MKSASAWATSPSRTCCPADMTVMENMQFFAGVQGMSKEDQKKRIPELLEFAGLSDFTGRLAGKLSGGMKKKLALACSLIHEPQVVLLDEPTLGVDPVSRREFWNLLGNLRAERGLTIFVNTPYMDEAERCTQIGLIYAGKLIASGAPADIKAHGAGPRARVYPGRFCRGAQAASNGMEGILEVQTYGEKLHVFVDDVARRKPQIEAALAAQGISHNELRQIEVRMEEAFISLVQRQNRLEATGDASHAAGIGERRSMSTDPSQNQPSIVVENLTKKFGDFTAVDNVSFSVNAGEVFGWLGPNGAGKTTTIRMLLGLMTPTSGSTHVLGLNSATQTKAMHAVVGYMSQLFTLYNDLTAAENIRFYGMVYGLSNSELKQRQAEIIHMAGLDGREKVLTGSPVRRLETAPGAGLRHRAPAQSGLSGRADRRG